MLLEHCHNLSFTDGLCLLFWHGWVLAQKQYGLQSLKYLLSASLQKVSQPLFQTKREIVRFPAFTRYYFILLNTYCVKSTFCAWLHWVLTRTSQQLSHKSNEVTQIMGVWGGGGLLALRKYFSAYIPSYAGELIWIISLSLWMAFTYD